jgi:hypothetical protein
MTKDITIAEKQRKAFSSFMQEHKLKASSWAKKAGLTEATIRHYLSGLNQSITSINLEKLAKAAGVAPNELLGIRQEQDESSIEIEKDLFIQTFVDLDNFIIESNLKLDAKTHANILLAWYELAQLLDRDHTNKTSIETFKNLTQKLLAQSV